MALNLSLGSVLLSGLEWFPPWQSRFAEQATPFPIVYNLQHGGFSLGESLLLPTCQQKNIYTSVHSDKENEGTRSGQYMQSGIPLQGRSEHDSLPYRVIY
jgi:hypothetical protein